MRGEQQNIPFDPTPAGAHAPRPRACAPGSARTQAPQLTLNFERQAPSTGHSLEPLAVSPSDVGAAPRRDPTESDAILVLPPALGAYLASEHPARLALEASIATALGRRVEVEITRNRRTMLSTTRTEAKIVVRLHRMFLDADADVVDAIGRYLKSGCRRASKRLGDFIAAHRDPATASPRRTVLRPQGRHHDLTAIFATVEEAHFPGALEGVTITWGRQTPKGRRRSIRLGTYTHAEKLIRLHPLLDQAWVPRAFVEYIVFHEMLHHVEPGREEAHRVLYHTEEFRRREAAYPGYAEALRWERANLGRLLGRT
jgi:hypothetical protein